MWMYSSSPAPTSASVSFTADGSPSKSVNHSEPCGASPGRLCTVWRIQSPSGSVGWQALM